MRSKGALFATVMVGAAALSILPAAVARADTSTSLTQLTGFNQMVVDDAAGYVFLSEGDKGTTGIVVTNASGNYVTTLDSGHDVAGLALSADGTTLYAALGADDAIGVINVSTLTQTQWPLPSSVTSPYSLALQSGDLWVSYDLPGGGAGNSGIGDFALPTSPSTSSPSFATQAAMGGWYSAPDIAADPSDTGILVAAQPGATPVTAATYSVTSGGATLLAREIQLADNCFERGVAVYPGGAEFLLCNNAYSTSTLGTEPDGGPVSTYAGANTVSADGSLVALAGYQANSVINVYPAGGTTPVNEFSLSGQIEPAGVAFSSDDSELYAVTGNAGGSGYTLSIIDDPGVRHTTLTLSGPSSPVTIGNSVTVNGGLQSYQTAVAGAPITITRTEAGSAASPEVLTATTAADGSFTLTDAPTTAGTYTYTAGYAGTATQAPATATFKVDVTLVGSALTLTAPSSSAAVGHAYTLAGTLRVGGGYPTAGTPVTITRTAAGSTAAKVFTAATGADGAFTLTDNPGAAGTYAYAASYPGGAGIEPATARFTMTVALAKSTLTLTARATAEPGTSYPVSVHLSLQTGGALAGAPIVITRTGAGTKAATYTAKTNASGAFTLTDKRTVLGTYTYTATYAGSATIAAAKETVKVVVAWPKPALTVRSSAARTGYNSRVTITAHLGASGTNRTLWIYAQTVGSTTMKLIAKGRVNAAGNLSVGYATTHSTIYTAEFAADSRYSATRANVTVGVFANVTMSNGGYYATQKINGISYRVYHHTGRLDTTVQVAPDKAGRCVDLEVDQYDPKSKQWDYNATFGCLQLNSSSKVSTYLTLNDAAGAQYRMFAIYTPTASDRLNLAGASGFLYFKVVT